jgi:ATP-dependent Clp protease adapter protein ClpS
MEEDDRVMPMPSCPHSLSSSLNQAEEELVAKALAKHNTGNHTSYAPSTLEPEIVDSHFHNMDLCILFHQMDDNTTHEVVKKALQKVLRQHVKKLGMKYDQDVHSTVYSSC